MDAIDLKLYMAFPIMVIYILIQSETRLSEDNYNFRASPRVFVSLNCFLDGVINENVQKREYYLLFES